jgi:putative NADH-flavin reductase
MKLLILGATGGTGRQLVAQALEHGHAVTVLVREPARLGTTDSNVRVVQGSLPGSEAALDAAMAGQDAVVSALGVGNGLKSRGLMAGAMPLVVEAMRRHRVPRLVCISAFGVGHTRADVPLGPRVAQRLLLADVFADKLASEHCVRASDLDWTLVYPSILTNGPRLLRYRAGERLPLRGFPSISRADVAAFSLAQLQAATFVRKGAMLSD